MVASSLVLLSNEFEKMFHGISSHGVPVSNIVGVSGMHITDDQTFVVSSCRFRQNKFGYATAKPNHRRAAESAYPSKMPPNKPDGCATAKVAAIKCK